MKKHKEQQKEAKKRKNASKNENAKRVSITDNELSDRALMANSSLPNPEEWILDTGATIHMTGCVDDFESFTPVQDRNVRIADNCFTPVTGNGTVRLRALTSDGRTRPILLQNVLLVPSFGQTRLFSWEKLREIGYELFSKGNNTFIRDRQGHKILWAISKSKSLVVQLEEYKARFSSYCEIHEALGHPSVTTVKTRL